MTVSNFPSQSGYAASQATAIAQRIPTLRREAFDLEQQRLTNALQQYISFATTSHLTGATIDAFWRGDRRAAATLRVVERLLEQPVGRSLDLIRQRLDHSRDLPIVEFQRRHGRAMFNAVSALRPASRQSDARHRAEQLQYTIELRAALLRSVWREICRTQRPTLDGVTMEEAHRQLVAFDDLIEAANETIDGTHKLLVALKQVSRTYIAQLRDELIALERDAFNEGIALNRHWQKVLARGEKHIQRYRQQQHETIERVAGGALNTAAPREVRLPSLTKGLGAALPQARRRHLYVTGAMLLSLGGAALAQNAHTAPAPLVESGEPTPSQSSGLRQRIADYFQRAGDTPTRRIDRLTIGSAATLQHVIVQLGSFGYRGEDVLRQFGLNSISAFSAPFTLELRWSAEGKPLVMPPAPATATGQSTLQVAGSAQPVRKIVPYQVQEGDTAQSIAERLNLTVDALLAENGLTEADLQPNRTIMVRAGIGAAVESLVKATTQQPTTASPTHDSPQVTSSGAIVPASAAAPIDLGDGEALVGRYGSQLFSSLEAMPADLNQYMTGTVQQVADFFNVRPGDILGILRAENNNAGFRVSQPATSSAGAKGVAQVVVRTWNGWSNPQASTHIRDLRSIEQYGGLGFDWSLREEWRAWKNGATDGSALANSNADPNRFENGVAAIARHLVGMGLTRDLAEQDPSRFRTLLADGIAIYNSGKPLSQSAGWTQSAANQKTVAQYVADAMAVSDSTPLNIAPGAPAAAQVNSGDVDGMAQQFVAVMDHTWGLPTTDRTLERARTSEVAQQVGTGQLSAEEGAQQLLAAFEAKWLSDGKAARDAGQPLPWPYIYDETSREAQRLAVKHTGQPLLPSELQALLTQSRGSVESIEQALAARPGSRLFAHAAQQMADKPVHEVNALLKSILGQKSAAQIAEPELAEMLLKVDASLQAAPAPAQSAPVTQFAATPLMPMPGIFKGFGAKVDYQAGGAHTGIDVANPREGGQEPPIYAVHDGTITYVGPLYCHTANACRGGNAIVIDHGDNVYSIYSHNSSASVAAGQQVAAGQEIGRQGNEGYSFGSHLHFEVHTGVPFSGNWQEPWQGGKFEDPAKWLP